MKVRKLNDSAAMRWGALGIVTFTTMSSYFATDVVAPLKTMLESELGWSSTDFGTLMGAYSFFNVFFLMLLWGGLILDRFGVRFTGKLSTILMVLGTILQYYGMEMTVDHSNLYFGLPLNVLVASAGYATVGVGIEVIGITVTKIIAKWFSGKEMAMAMGVQLALSRIGSQVAFSVAIPIAKAMGITVPVLIGLVLLVLGMIAFFFYSVMDKRFDREMEQPMQDSEEEKFSINNVGTILKSSVFWLIALLCVLFYASVFPFQKFASDLMINKYGIDEDFAGSIAGLPALGGLILTPIFGRFIDKRGKSASVMMFGAGMLIFVHFVYALPFVTEWTVAVGLMLLLGIAFSLVPSAMWPAVAKIFPSHQLGTAYSLIFLVQNVGLWGVPVLIGFILDDYCKLEGGGYDYTLPMCVFTFIAILSFVVAFMLKKADKKYGYHLEDPNIKA
ncbi:MAG: MFS transporter [Phocaeicola sp.]